MSLAAANRSVPATVDNERSAKRLCLRTLGPPASNKPLAVMSFQPQQANAVWTRSELTALYEHLHNDNGITHFVMGFRDDDGCKKYVRSKRLPVSRAISWACASIANSSKSRLAFVPYSANDQQQSRWGGMDFDAHQEGQADRARELAFAAFRVLLNLPDVAVILETSGSGGWHVWVISPDFHDTRDWIRLLKSVSATIGAPVVSGVCEIFPPDSLPSRYGKGMRAPGSWNPGTDKFNEIVWENTRTSLESVLSGKSKKRSLNSKRLPDHFPDTEKETSFSSPLYHESELLKKLGITASGTRNEMLGNLVGEVFNQVGRDMAQRLVTAQYHSKTVMTKANETEHIASFEKLWAGLANRWAASLMAPEREIFNRLETENERDAFRIIRGYARKAAVDGVVDFPIVRDNLAERLGITGKGAAWIRDKFVKLGITAKTANYVPNKFAARFRWLLDSPKAGLPV